MIHTPVMTSINPPMKLHVTPSFNNNHASIIVMMGYMDVNRTNMVRLFVCFTVWR
jgi:hypothetical protein